MHTLLDRNNRTNATRIAAIPRCIYFKPGTDRLLFNLDPYTYLSDLALAMGILRPTPELLRNNKSISYHGGWIALHGGFFGGLKELVLQKGRQ